MTRRAVFIDRDGVINNALIKDGNPHPPIHWTELEIMPGVHEALELLREAGFVLIVVTNQPDVARGIQTREMVQKINSILIEKLPIDDIRVCYHDDFEGCECRKPAPGLIVGAARDHQVDLALSYMVGDRWKDIEAGKQAKCQTVFIDHHYAETRDVDPTVRVGTLMEAAEWILKRRENE